MSPTCSWPRPPSTPASARLCPVLDPSDICWPISIVAVAVAAFVGALNSLGFSPFHHHHHNHHYHCHLPPRFQRILVAQVHFCYCLSSWVFFSFCLECRSFLSTHQLLVAAFWLICIFISMSGRWDFLSISAFSATHCVAKDIYVAIFTFFNLLLGWF